MIYMITHSGDEIVILVKTYITSLDFLAYYIQRNETKRTKRTKRAKRTKQTKRIFDQIKNNHRIHLKRVVSLRLDIPKANCNKSKEWECS